jgi:hypothetical protein
LISLFSLSTISVGVSFLDLGTCTNHSGECVRCSIRAFLVVLPS